MHKYLRSTRRGWMVFTEADKGGAAGAVADAPPLEESHVEKSKSIFAKERQNPGLDNPPAEPPPPPAAPEPPKTDDVPPTDTPPSKKSVVPEDVIDPEKAK